MITQTSTIVIFVLAFGAVTAVVFLLGQFVSTQIRVHQRLGHHAEAEVASEGLTKTLDGLVSTYFDEKKFGIEGSVRAKLRQELLRAGYFRADAINYYVFARLALVAVLPALAFGFGWYFMSNYSWFYKLGLVALMMLVAIFGPDAYIARRQRTLQTSYRLAFPDLLDLMVVCVDAGLGLEAALERISPEIMRQNKALGMNLVLMGAEGRAGRSTIDALDSLTDRLGLEEARSFAAMLRQSIELGTDVGEALRVFSDEMRDRRLLRAEERANQLPVKMVAPLGAFIFPVILMTVMIPIVLRLMSALPK
jgi:tight adherence protein C